MGTFTRGRRRDEFSLDLECFIGIIPLPFFDVYEFNSIRWFAYGSTAMNYRIYFYTDNKALYIYMILDCFQGFNRSIVHLAKSKTKQSLCEKQTVFDYSELEKKVLQIKD